MTTAAILVKARGALRGDDALAAALGEVARRAASGVAGLHVHAAEGWLDEMMRWYDREHMPGLAAVPGCVRAQRFINLDAGPKSFACYDLVTRDTLGSPPWLAVRNSEWSGRVRPNFRNTKRTMFRTLP